MRSKINSDYFDESESSHSTATTASVPVPEPEPSVCPSVRSWPPQSTGWRPDARIEPTMDKELGDNFRSTLSAFLTAWRKTDARRGAARFSRNSSARSYSEDNDSEWMNACVIHQYSGLVTLPPPPPSCFRQALFCSFNDLIHYLSKNVSVHEVITTVLRFIGWKLKTPIKELSESSFYL